MEEDPDVTGQQTSFIEEDSSGDEMQYEQRASPRDAGPSVTVDKYDKSGALAITTKRPNSRLQEHSRAASVDSSDSPPCSRPSLRIRTGGSPHVCTLSESGAHTPVSVRYIENLTVQQMEEATVSHTPRRHVRSPDRRLLLLPAGGCGNLQRRR